MRPLEKTTLRLSLAWFCLTALILAAWQSRSEEQGPLPRASEVVTPRVYVSLAPVPRSRTFEIAVVGKIRPGFHVNAHIPSEEYLIPTALDAELPQGIRALNTSYPPGVLRKFGFSEKELSVYEDSFTVRMKLEASRNVPLGALQIPLTLRYQACNQEMCLPPVKVPVTAEIEIAPAGSAARRVNQSVFDTPSSKTPVSRP